MSCSPSNTSLIDKAEKCFSQAMNNVNIVKDELFSYSGEKRKTYLLELKKSELSITKTYNDLQQIKENKENPSSNEIPVNVANFSNIFSNLPTTRRTTVQTNYEYFPRHINTFQPINNVVKKDADLEDGTIIVEDDLKVANTLQQHHHSKVDTVLDIHDKNNQILDNMIKIGEETIQVGDLAAKKLKEQTEKMILIQKDLDELGDGLQRAKKELASFIRGTHCDKIVICIFIVAVMAMIGVIITWQVAKVVCIKGTNVCAGMTNINNGTVV